MIAIDDEKLKKIVLTYGAYPQISKAVEELIELSEILIKDINKSELYKDSLIEEMADVEVMLSQLKIIYNVSDEELQDEISRKIDRTMKRIEEDSKYIGDCETCKHIKVKPYDEPCKICNHHEGSMNMYEPYVPDCPWK